MLPKRGEIWLVEFDPQRGAEIAKTRPASDMSAAAPKPSELQKLSPKKRDNILQKQAKRAALLYASSPDLIAESSDDVITY